MGRTLTHNRLLEMRVALLRGEAVDGDDVLLAVDELLREREENHVEKTWSAHGISTVGDEG